MSGFHAVKDSGGIDLYLSQGDETVAVSASEIKFRDRIRTEVKDGVLKIGYEYENKHINISWGNRKLKAYVSAKTLDALGACGGSDIDVEGYFKTDKLDLHVSGGSDFKGTMEVSELKAHASGGSDINISGTAKSAYLDASGGSDVYFTVNKELTVEATGGSDIHYKGTGLIHEIKSSSGGSIKKISK